MSTVGHLSPGLYPPSYPCRHPCAVCCQHGSLPPALPLSLVVSASPFHSCVSITDVFRASQVLSSLQDPPLTLPTLLARVLHSPHRQAFVSSCSNRLLPWSSRSASLLHEPSPALPRCALPSRTCSLPRGAPVHFPAQLGITQTAGRDLCCSAVLWMAHRATYPLHSAAYVIRAPCFDRSAFELCFVRPLFDLCFVRPLFDLCFFRSEFRSIYAPNDRTALIGVWQALLAFSGSARSISGARPTSILESRVHFRFWRKFCPNRQIWRLSNRQISPDLAI